MVRRKSEPNGWFVMHACAMSAINLAMTGTQIIPSILCILTIIVVHK